VSDCKCCTPPAHAEALEKDAKAARYDLGQLQNVLADERAAHAETKRALVRAEKDALLEKDFAAFKATDSRILRDSLKRFLA
jgi:hypothetical protein